VRPPARQLVVLLLVVAVVVGLGGGCRKSKDKPTARPTTTSSPPVTGRGVAGVPGVDSGTTGTTTGPGGCLALPAEAEAKTEPHPDMPPLPDGTRWLERVNPQPGQTLVIAAVPETLPKMQERIRKVWFPGGWRELAGESEPGREVEGVFQRQDVRLGMRARVLYCEEAWLEVRMVVNR